MSRRAICSGSLIDEVFGKGNADGLDGAGHRLFATVPLTLTTAAAADRLLDRPDGGWVKVTGVPAQHGPDGSEHVTERATGFMPSGTDAPTVYTSGGNPSLENVGEGNDPTDICY
ncbi:hypothetical protein [Streptomyces sp. NPDC051286]|uniref:hypothetical protein n=1 Tax=Streptomyces sp. NPDC051286 TaxID=3365647 RepID=UPI0037B80399